MSLRVIGGFVAWLAVLAALTALMVAFRQGLEKVHITLAFLLVILAGSSVSGRAVGVTLAIAAFLAFNWFLLPPYYTFRLENQLDWFVLFVFLSTGIVAAQLLHRAQNEAQVARARAAEIDRLAALGAETLSVGSAEASLRAVTEVIRASTGATSCDITVRGGSAGPIEQWVMDQRRAAATKRDGTVHLHAARPTEAELANLAEGAVLTLALPLEIRERTIGVLRIGAPDGLHLSAEGWRFLNAISYYAALAVERVRLVAEADRAEALRETNRLKDALLASVSHDLRTPLTTIKALAHDLAAHGDERSEIIEREADRLNRIVADLLDLSRLNAGALPVRMELNAVDDLLGALAQSVESRVRPPRLRISLPADDALLVGTFDLVHSVRILANLVENAAKYSPADAPIDVQASRAGDRLVLRVLDRGPGIAPAHAARIFEPFYRVDESAAVPEGAGLGLAIARGLAEAQGGSITHAPREGGGCSFTLELAAADVSEAAASAVPLS